MGRRRIKVEVDQELLHAQTQQCFDVTDEDGLYPFSNTFAWRPQNGKDKGKQVSLTLDAEATSKMEVLSKANNTSRFFYSEFRECYPWAVRALSRGIKTLCVGKRVSHSEGSYTRNSVGVFLAFCRREEVKLDDFEDLSFQLLCRWRSDLRLDERNSRYKAALFRRFCKLLELLMGTEEYPVKFSVPVYQSDAPDQLPPYGDAVMYQLIAAAISDIERVMVGAERFRELTEDILKANPPRWPFDKYDWKILISDFVQGGCSVRRAAEDMIGVDEAARYELTRKSSYVYSRHPEAFSLFFEKVGLVGHSGDGEPLAALRRLDEKEVSSRDSLFPFFLFFIITSGANKETVYSWKRSYKVDGKTISPLDWKDPFDPSRCRVRGIKYRGKGKLVASAEDTWIQIADDGIYPILKFLIWYTEPLSILNETVAADSELHESLWLYREKSSVFSYEGRDAFSVASQSFLKRHEISDVQYDEDGSFTAKRIMSLDSRRFRKVFTAKELLKAIKSSQNFQELANQLQCALHHAQFDTTLASYMSLGKSKDIIDVGIFTLQSQMIEAARKFRGARIEHSNVSGRPGIYTACADPAHPDYEKASTHVTSECGEYDMCLGCTQSRVFSIHLPRIAMRIIQYESFKITLSPDAWESAFGNKTARAYDVLAGWSKKEEVEQAWQQARAGNVFLPQIIVRG
ncbi:hypothetical protein [Pseudomonas sp. NPDC090201]|uniref:hypothetical protein n=1 Tax=Pseudomonas sp. NPDC090201 TaxID=3364475 RepID=UPI00380EC508